MKKFRIALPAHVIIEINATTKERATIMAKAQDGTKFRTDVLGVKVDGEIGKFVVGCDAMEEIPL